MRFASGILALVWFCVVTSFAAQPDRITTTIDSNQFVVLKSGVHAKALPSFDRGPVDPGMTLPYITMLMKPSAAQQADLNHLLAQQQNPSSPEYHKWLTPEQYADRFGLSPHDMAQVSDWLKAQGFNVVQTARGRDWIAFSGTAAAVQNTFHTAIDRFEVDGEKHFANAKDISIPQALSGTVAGFRGLNDFRFKPMSHATALPPGVFFPAVVHPFYTSGGSHFLAPDDIATIYDINPLYNAGIDGTGMKLAVVGQVDVDMTDIEDFRNGFNLPANDPTVVLVPGSPDPGNSQGDLVESDLDLEWAGAVARNASILFVTAAPSTGGVFNSALYVIDQKLAQVISMSYGGCESINAQFIQGNEPSMQKANTEGITFVASSGDTGAAACDAGDNPPVRTATKGLSVNYPASSPEVSGIGGTEFNEGSGNYWNGSNGANGGSAISYIPEESWNDTVERNELAASGGGKSSCGVSNNGTCTAGFPKPSWQLGNTDTVRDVPDVSFSASPDHDGFMICSGGSCSGGIAPNFVVGGTSASAPVFAGIVTLLNQFVGNTPPAGLGNVNTQIYLLAQDPTNDAIHDVTTGDNKVPCTKGSKDCANGGTIGYSAATGYDKATGLGSVDVNNLACHWTSKLCVSVSLTAVPQQIVVGFNQPVVLTATVAAGFGTNVPTGTVTFFKNSTQIGQGTLTNGTATFNYDASALTAHRYAMTVQYGGDSNFGSATSTAVELTVGTPSSTGLNLSTATVLVGSTDSVTLTANVTGGSGTPTGTVIFHEGVTQLATGTLSGGTATANYDPKSLTVGTHAIVASYSGDTNFADSDSAAEQLKVQDYSLSETPSTMSISAPGGTGAGTITVTPVNGFGDAVTFTCSGLPAESSCTFNPASVSPSGGPVNTAITVSTTAPTARMSHPLKDRSGIFYAMLLPGFFGVVLISSPRRRQGARWLFLAMLLCATTLWLPACGGGSSGSQKTSDPGTPVGAKTVTVTATTSGSSQLSHKVTFTLTVLQ